MSVRPCTDEAAPPVQPADAQVTHSALPRRLVRISGMLLVVLIVSAVLGANLGPVRIPLSQVLAAVFGPLWSALGGHVPAVPSQVELILFRLRLPRVVLGAVVGGALSVAGAALQGMLMNPLADPYLIGVSAGAALGASVAILGRLQGLAGGLGVHIAAFGSAAVTMALVYRLAVAHGRIQREAFILAGVVVGSLMWALVTFIMSIAGQDLQTVVMWLMGYLGGEQTPLVVTVAFAVCLAGSVAIYAFARDLNLLTLGEEPARQLGVEVESLKRILILLCSLLTGVAVSVSGVIGFIGLIVPHAARRLFGPDHRLLLPASGLMGASLLIWADSLARVLIPPSEIPVGVITALLGAPFFLYLLKSRVERS